MRPNQGPGGHRPAGPLVKRSEKRPSRGGEEVLIGLAAADGKVEFALQIIEDGGLVSGIKRGGVDETAGDTAPGFRIKMVEGQLAINGEGKGAVGAGRKERQFGAGLGGWNLWATEG